MIEAVVWFFVAVTLLFAASLFAVTVALVVAIQLHWFPGVRLRPGKPPTAKAGPALTPEQVAAARTLYDSNDAAIRAALATDPRLASAGQRATDHVK